VGGEEEGYAQGVEEDQEGHVYGALILLTAGVAMTSFTLFFRFIYDPYNVTWIAVSAGSSVVFFINAILLWRCGVNPYGCELAVGYVVVSSLICTFIPPLPLLRIILTGFLAALLASVFIAFLLVGSGLYLFKVLLFDMTGFDADVAITGLIGDAEKALDRGAARGSEKEYVIARLAEAWEILEREEEKELLGLERIELWLDLSQALDRAGEAKRAAQALERAAKGLSGDWRVRMDLYKLYMKLGWRREALDQLEEAAKLAQDREEVLHLLRMERLMQVSSCYMRILLVELAKLLGFKSRKELKKWLLSLPKDIPIRIDGGEVILSPPAHKPEEPYGPSKAPEHPGKAKN